MKSELYHFYSRKCIRKCRLANWRPFCPGGDELTDVHRGIPDFPWWSIKLQFELAYTIRAQYIFNYKQLASWSTTANDFVRIIRNREKIPAYVTNMCIYNNRGNRTRATAWSRNSLTDYVTLTVNAYHQQGVFEWNFGNQHQALSPNSTDLISVLFIMLVYKREGQYHHKETPLKHTHGKHMKYHLLLMRRNS